MGSTIHTNLPNPNRMGGSDHIQPPLPAHIPSGPRFCAKHIAGSRSCRLDFLEERSCCTTPSARSSCHLSVVSGISSQYHWLTLCKQCFVCDLRPLPRDSMPPNRSLPQTTENIGNCKVPKARSGNQIHISASVVLDILRYPTLQELPGEAICVR